MSEMPVLDFALGSEVSGSNFYKSTFARAYVNSRDAISLDPKEMLNSAGRVFDGEVGMFHAGGAVNGFHSMVNAVGADERQLEAPASNFQDLKQKSSEEPLRTQQEELEAMLKKCALLTQENERLKAKVASQQAKIDNIDIVCYQTQINTLTWQLKQSEANRTMYRSVMKQVEGFLERCQKSLDSMHERNTGSKVKHSTGPKDKSRVPRSRSVHTVHTDHSDSTNRMNNSYSCSSSTTSSSSSSSSPCHFNRTKSSVQIATNCNGSSNGSVFNWPMLRRIEPCNSRSKQSIPNVSTSAQDVNKTLDSVPYKRPMKPTEMSVNEVPPDKLAQETFRLRRTVHSLLNMQEPDLARLSISQMPDTISLENHGETSSLFRHSTLLQESTTPPASSSSDRGTEGSSTDDEMNRSAPDADLSILSQTTLKAPTPMTPGSAQSIDGTLLNSTIGKYNGAEVKVNGNCSTVVECVPRPISSTPSKLKRSNRRELSLKSLTDWALRNSGGSTTVDSKPATSVSSVEDESGFSSLSSFQEVGLPNASPIKSGCHTEVGLPEVPIDKVRHRRWSSTPAEHRQASFKRHSASFFTDEQATESFSFWV